ncbi:hypothetical protein VXN63_04905 [Marinilactibacillus sp. XAAS-LB27]|uniref:hypothetical protein n=1 Tax=Marinilactibacillus sp. XAAS-LB27 TaxID=3114538 RepID=UPI002E19D37B|nr:hypothetical protein [Marinilactibacillus sp. XAAS-LB27]
MSITIHRKTKTPGSSFLLKLEINNQQIEKIRPNQMIELDIPGQTATVALKQFAVRNKPITIGNDDFLEITVKPSFNYYYWTLIVSFTTLFFILSLKWRLILIFFLLLQSLIVGFFYNFYELKIIKKL